MAYGIQDPIDLARVIAGMSYGGLLEVARDLVDMNKDEDVKRDVGTEHGMADTLYDWAKAQVETADEEARLAKAA
ncbi:MAG: hypothetical protein WC213_00220 [Arenimonas sp.]|jgi:hypothetical protein